MLTIIVPTYQRPGLLAQCLQSIRDQSFTDFQVLVCDNSPDREAEPVVAALADPRFVYCGRGRNLGILQNVLLGFQAAKSPYVMEVDDDDLLLDGALESLVTPLLQDPELTLAFADLDVVDVSGRVLLGQERTAFIPERLGLGTGRLDGFTHLAARGWVYMMSSIIRADVVDWHDVPEQVSTAYDRYVALACARHGAPAYFVARPLVAYRVHADADGMRYESRQLAGALVALRSERVYASGAALAVIDNEIVRCQFMYARALGYEKQWMPSARAFAAVLRPRSLRRVVVIAVKDYIPRRLERSRGGMRSRARQRRNLRA